MKDSFKDLTFDELLTKREELRVKYRDLRFNIVVGHVDNPLEKRELRRKITRLNTMIYNHAEVLGHSAAAGSGSAKSAAVAQADKAQE